MINREELERIKDVLGFTIWQAEKDYLQHLILLFLSRSSRGELAFKGGTALQKAYGLGRFSIDLDFTLSQAELDTKRLLESIASDMSMFGYATTFELEERRSSKQAKFKIEGPLYGGTEKTRSTVRLDISTRETPLIAPHVLNILPVYPDVQPYFVTVMAAEEILCEKIRAAMCRTNARDIYDVWFLLNKNVRLDIGMANKKLEYCNMKFSKKSFLYAIDSKKAVWESELGQLLKNLPEFPTVRKYIAKQLTAK